MTTTINGLDVQMELSDPRELFEVRPGTISRCVDPDCNGSISGEIHGEFWLKRTLYRQWMGCSCEVCGREDKELIEVYDHASQYYVLLNYMTIHDTTLDVTYQLPGFGASIAGLIQGAQKDGYDPAILMQETINKLMKRERRRKLEAQCSQ